MSSQLSAPAGADYSESRQHEVRKTRMLMVDGNLTANSETIEGGTSARVFNKGYWGFASVPAMDQESVSKVAKKAAQNATTMCRFGEQPNLDLPLENHVGEYGYNGLPPMAQKERLELIEMLNAHCADKYPDLKAATILLQQENHEKRIATSNGSLGLATINRSGCYIIFTAEDEQGRPVELMEIISGRGNLGSLDLSMETLEPKLAALYGHIQAKCAAVAPRGGEQTVIIAPPLAGMLAHEAMGHPCEADIVLGGAVTRSLVGKEVASELISMVDLAHTYNGEELMIPVYVDDEGSEARDVTMIEKGILKEFMSSRETAARLGIAPTGNARAYTFNDEPLVRMRNTAIRPG